MYTSINPDLCSCTYLSPILRNFQIICSEARERFLGLKYKTTMTAQTITRVLITAAATPVLQFTQAVVKLNTPCQVATISTLPWVLLYSQVKVIAPASSPTRKPGKMEISYE